MTPLKTWLKCLACCWSVRVDLTREELYAVTLQGRCPSCGEFRIGGGFLPGKGSYGLPTRQ